MGNSICPICQSNFKDSEGYALTDGVICKKCADDLRFRYPMIYIPEYHKLDDLRILEGCSELRQTDLRLLRDSMREIKDFKVISGSTENSSVSYTAAYEVDRMKLFSLDEFKNQLVCADALEDRIRLDYMDYTNVMVVDCARPLSRKVGKDGIQNLRKKQSGFCVTGYIKAGSFRDGDMIGILHEGKIRYADIIALDYECHTITPKGGDQRMKTAESLGDKGDRGHCIRAGYQVTMVLNKKAEGIGAGDLIVTD